MQRMLLTLALVAAAGTSYAQTMTPSQTMPTNQAVPSTEPRDPYGRPFIGRNDFVRQRADQPGPSGSSNLAPNMATAPAAPPAATMPQQSGPRQATFKDEYGFRYDSEGNRLDARGNVISPQTR